MNLLPAQRGLGLVDHLFGLVLRLVDHLLDLVFRVADLLFGLTSAVIGLASGLEVLVSDEASDGLFGVTLYLISLCSHPAPSLLVEEFGVSTWIDHALTFHCALALSCRARGESPSCMPPTLRRASEDRADTCLRGSSGFSSPRGHSAGPAAGDSETRIPGGPSLLREPAWSAPLGEPESADSSGATNEIDDRDNHEDEDERAQTDVHVNQTFEMVGVHCIRRSAPPSPISYCAEASRAAPEAKGLIPSDFSL